MLRAQASQRVHRLRPLQRQQRALGHRHHLAAVADVGDEVAHDLLGDVQAALELLDGRRRRIEQDDIDHLLVAGRRVRGTWLDPFGRAGVRRVERQLPDEFEAHVRRLLSAAPVDVAELTRVGRLLVGDKELNAFATSGIQIGLNTGLILQTENPNELMGVIAHEAGHLAGGHPVRSGEMMKAGLKPMLLTMGLGVLAALAGSVDGAAALMGSLPIAIGFGAGGSARMPLGLAVVGGRSVDRSTLGAYRRLREVKADVDPDEVLQVMTLDPSLEQMLHDVAGPAGNQPVVLEPGLAARLFVRLLQLLPATLARFGLVRDQIHFLGNYSLAIIGVSGLFVGFVLALQGYYILQRYGSAEALGMMVALSLLRELGPVVTALLFAGRAGTALTAEIGLMKAGEQLSAMEMMAVDPIRRVLAPRFWAGVFTMPLLAAVFSAVGIVGGWLVGVVMIGVDAGSFWSQMQGGVEWWNDLGNGVIKSLVFGVTVSFVALYQGYETQATPEGVAHATTRTVVIASLGVLAMDFVLTALMFSTP